MVLLTSLIVTGVLTLARFNQSLWLDEGSSVWFARLPLTTLLHSLCDPHPPGYYVLLKTWLIAGDSEAWLRALSLLAALLAIVLLYQIGKEHGGKACAGLAALLLALQPLQSWYGSEVRMYALTQAAGLALVWLGWRIIAGSSQRRLIIAYLLVAIAALWIDYTALLAWGLLQLIWIANGSPRARRWMVWQSIVLLPGIIGLVTAGQSEGLRQSYQPIFLALQANSLGLPLTPTTATLALQVSAGLALLASLAYALWVRQHGFLKSPWSQSVVVGLWVLLLILSIAPRLFTLKRVLVVLLPYLALTTAYILTRWPRTLTRALIALEAVAVVMSLFTLQREPWREVVTEALTTEPADVIWVDDLAVPVFDYYARRAASPAPNVIQDTLIGRDLPRTPQATPAPDRTLTIIVNDTPYRRLLAFLPQEFYEEYALIAEQHALGIGAYRYQRRTQPEKTTPLNPTLQEEWGLSLPSPLATCTRSQD